MIEPYVTKQLILNSCSKLEFDVTKGSSINPLHKQSDHVVLKYIEYDNILTTVNLSIQSCTSILHTVFALQSFIQSNRSFQNIIEVTADNVLIDKSYVLLIFERLIDTETVSFKIRRKSMFTGNYGLDYNITLSDMNINQLYDIMEDIIIYSVREL